jgi:hypothetical protein
MYVGGYLFYFIFTVDFIPIAPEFAISLFIRTQHTLQRRYTCCRKCFQGLAALRCDTVWQLQKEMWLVLPS